MSTGKELMERVHIVEDHEEMRQSIEWTLRGVGYDVHGHADAESWWASFNPNEPCCTILDLLLPGMTGLTICQKLASMNACCGVVMISAYGDIPSAVEAMKHGAVDFLEKPFGRERLLSSVQTALRYSNDRFLERTEERQFSERLGQLSPRELEIFELMADGLVTKQIAAQLSISPKTVDVHRSSITQKLKLEAPSQLGYLLSVHQRVKRRSKSENPASLPPTATASPSAPVPADSGKTTGRPEA